MKELFIKYFRDASSYQSIDPTCFNLTEYTETWLINHKKQLTIPRVRQQRELLIAFAKYMEEDKMYARHDEANVDDFLEAMDN